MSTAIFEEARARFPFRLTDGVDHKAWAKRIMYRQEQGDTTLLAVQVQFAKTALNIQDKAAA